jgi:hypothetical protein
MKGQGEIMVFVLLFLISMALFVSATLWSKGIFQQNVDAAKMQGAEKFMKDLNENIQSVIKFGGSKEVKYGMGGTMRLVDSQTIEVDVPVDLPLSNTWINISSDSSYYIQEKMDGDYLRLQLNYTSTDYQVQFFTDSSSMTNPGYVYVENNQTTNIGRPVIKIKITFA